MSGGLGIIAAGLGLFGPACLDGKALFVATGFVGVIVAAFILWRAEYRKNAEDPVLADERRKIFDRHIADLHGGQPWLLRKVTIDKQMHESGGATGLNYLAQKTNLIGKDGDGIFRPNPTYQRLLEEWVKRTPDPLDKIPGRAGPYSSD